jgi:hypothetical protein
MQKAHAVVLFGDVATSTKGSQGQCLDPYSKGGSVEGSGGDLCAGTR